MTYSWYSSRTLGLWALYATLGILLLAMLAAGGGDLGSENRDSPTRLKTKLLAIGGGLSLAVAALGVWVLSDPAARPGLARWMVGLGAPLGAVLSAWSWAWIARDLNGRAKAAR